VETSDHFPHPIHTEMAIEQPLLSVQNLVITYPRQQVPAIDGVSFQINAGEKVGFVGESGCGKSTIGKAILGLLPPGTEIGGDLRFDGRSIASLAPEEMRRFRGEAVGLVFQDPMTRLNPLMTIGNHCLETILAHTPELSRSEAKQRAYDTLAAVRIDPERWSQYPHEFSGGMRQRVAIALALLLQPKLIIADEPTTSLDVRVSAEILQELTRLCRERDMALMLISHDLATIGEYCDRIVVMNRGKKEEEGTVDRIFKSPSATYTQTLLNSALHVQTADRARSIPNTQTPLLKLDRLQKYYQIEGGFLERLFNRNTRNTIRAVDDINLELYPGEIFGLVGESGCGKSTLSRTILQLIPATGGKVEFNGEDLTKLSPAQMRAKRRELQMIFQDPSACLNPMMTVGESIADPLIIHQIATSPAQIRERVEEMLERVGLTPTSEYYDRYPNQLSGGQQQRVGIARALITKPKLAICDEPVSMLDATIQAEVLDLMLELQRKDNLTYLFITHDLWLAKFLCDRIAVMNRGQIVEMGETQKIFSAPEHPYTRELLAAAPMLAKQLN
jgi:peptide/nickel transport system ATP-binding protein